MSPNCQTAFTAPQFADLYYHQCHSCDMYDWFLFIDPLNHIKKSYVKNLIMPRLLFYPVWFF